MSEEPAEPTEPAEPAVNSSFSKKLPTLQLAIDSTSLGLIEDCWQKYYLSIVRGFAPRGENVHFRFGLEVHSGLEHYHHLRADGISFEEALRATVRYTLDSTWDERLRRPWNSGDELKNRYTLVRTLVDYLDNFKNDTLETVRLRDGSAAVERSFRINLDIIASTGEHYILCGHLDRLARFLNELCIPDVKTTKNPIYSSYFQRFSPDTQMSVYDYAGTIIFEEPVTRIIIDAIQITPNETKFQRGIINRTDSQRAEWIESLKYHLALVDLAAQRNHWPMNPQACGRVHEDPTTGSVTYGCPFRKVCGAAPEMREELLALNYIKRTWDPLKPRERKQQPTETELITA